MTMLYNTLSEISTRILILLSECNESKDLESLTFYDLFATYGNKYGFLDSNLHGETIINLNEYANRFSLIGETVKFLVRNCLINIKNTSEGFAYTINNDGLCICERLSSPYALEYKNAVRCILSKTQNYSKNELKKTVFNR